MAKGLECDLERNLSQEGCWTLHWGFSRVLPSLPLLPNIACIHNDGICSWWGIIAWNTLISLLWASSCLLFNCILLAQWKNLGIEPTPNPDSLRQSKCGYTKIQLTWNLPWQNLVRLDKPRTSWTRFSLFMIVFLVPVPEDKSVWMAGELGQPLWPLFPSCPQSLFTPGSMPLFESLKHTKLVPTSVCFSLFCLKHTFSLSSCGWPLFGFRSQLKCHLPLAAFSDHSV